MALEGHVAQCTPERNRTSHLRTRIPALCPMSYEGRCAGGGIRTPYACRSRGTAGPDSPTSARPRGDRWECSTVERRSQCPRQGSNLGPLLCESSATSAELHGHRATGAARRVRDSIRALSRIRTCDPLIRNQMRYPLRHQGMSVGWVSALTGRRPLRWTDEASRTRSRSRTCNTPVLSRLPLPLGYPGLVDNLGIEPSRRRLQGGAAHLCVAHGADGRSRNQARSPCRSSPRAFCLCHPLWSSQLSVPFRAHSRKAKLG
jgi:hypothetical protein